MQSFSDLRGAMPEATKDLRLNLERVLAEDTLSPAQRWGVALASAFAAQRDDLVALLRAEGAEHLGDDVVSDAQAAAGLMAMNNVYYRFRHFMGDDSPYAKLPAGLRMSRLAKPATTKADLELFSLAVSAINGCELCVQSHDQVVRDAGLTPEQVHAAVRIAAVVHGVAGALAIPQAAVA